MFAVQVAASRNSLSLSDGRAPNGSSDSHRSSCGTIAGKAGRSYSSDW